MSSKRGKNALQDRKTAILLTCPLREDDERRNMTQVKLSIEAIRAVMKLTRSEMAEKLGVSLDRYNRLATGESKLLATEFCKLQEISGVPFENIQPYV